MTDEQLRTMAESAFIVFNWARREGMKKDQQLGQVVSAFRFDLLKFEVETGQTCCLNLSSSECAQVPSRQCDGMQD